MEKKPFLTLEQAKDIIKDVPTPFHVYDEKGIRENARALNKAFAWNKGYKEYFAVKATPNPFLMKMCYVRQLQISLLRELLSHTISTRQKIAIGMNNGNKRVLNQLSSAMVPL